MVAVDAQERNGQFGKVLLAEYIKRAGMEVDACIAKDDQNIIAAGLHLTAE